MATETVSIKFDINDKEGLAKLGAVTRALEKLEKTDKGLDFTPKQGGGSGLGGLAGTLGVIGGIATTAFAALAAGTALAASKVISLTADWENYRAVLTNTTGSADKANEMLKQAEEFAATTPFSVGEIAKAFADLSSRGIDPTIERMTSLGDITASVTDKTVDDAVQMLADARMFQYDRLADFGFDYVSENGKLTMTYRGVTEVIEENKEAIEAYFIRAGKYQGVAGLMAAKSATLGGAISNLKDAFESLARGVGEKLSPIITPLIRQFTDFVSGAGPKVSAVFDKAYQVVTDLAQGFEGLMDTGIVEWVVSYVEPVFNNVVSIFKNVVATITEIINNIKIFYAQSPMLQAIVKLLEDIGDKATIAFNYILDGISEVIEFFTTNEFGQAVLDFILAPIYLVLDAIDELLTGFNAIGNFFKGDEEAPDRVGFASTADRQQRYSEMGVAATREAEVLPEEAGASIAATSTNLNNLGASVASSGVRSITINIETLIGEQSITQAQNPLEVKRLVERALITAVSDATASF